MSTKEEALSKGTTALRELLHILRVLLHIVVIISVLFAMWYILCIWYGFSDGRTLDITDSNRAEISYLMPDEIKSFGGYRDLAEAESIETYSTFLDNELVINYSDGNEFSCEIDYRSNLRQLIEDQGYPTYPHTAEFYLNILKLALSVAVCAVCAVYLKKTKRKTAEECVSNKEKTETVEPKRYRLTAVSNKSGDRLGG